MRDEPFDLVIVGAGIVGVACAWIRSQSAPPSRILLLERAQVGGAATAVSGGHLHPHGASPEQRALSRVSAGFFHLLRQRHPELPLYDRPLVGVVSRDQLLPVVAGYHDHRVAPANADQRAALLESFPGLKISAHQEALYGCTSGYGLPPDLARALVRILVHDGLRCWEGAEAVALTTDGGQVEIALSDGRRVCSRQAVIAAGPALLAGPLRGLVSGADLRIKKVVAMHLYRAVRPADPILYLFDDDAYLIPHQQAGYWLYSFPADEWDCPPEVSSLSIQPRDRALARAILERTLPGWFDAHCHGGRVFCDVYSPDRLPFISQVPGMPGVALASGCSGYGFRLAPAIAARALDLAAESAGAESEASR